jgi:hypothetical protein
MQSTHPTDPDLKPHGGEQGADICLLFWAVLATGMAGGLGWGIRGQFGHESGAMIAGALTSFTLILLFAPRVSALKAARAVAWMTVAIGIGGSMTYGQTIGLTHDHEIHRTLDGQLNGNSEAIRWGMIGLFIKGGIWIGFGGLLLGMGLGGKQYRVREMCGVMAGALALMVLGIWLINSPFDPENKILPWIYFSDDWYFEPLRDLKPRPEVWGGFLLALIGMAVYARFKRKDRLAGRMVIVGFIAGGIGFPAGQFVQVLNAWHPELFREHGALGLFSDFTGGFNWWNTMETTFGFIFGAILAFGLWLNRHLVAIEETPEEVTISPRWEIGLFLAHMTLVLVSEFLRVEGWGAELEFYIEYGPLLACLPLIAIAGGRLWPYLMLFPMVAAPIVGKALRQLCYRSDNWSLASGWLLLVVIPALLLIGLAVWLIHRSRKGQTAWSFASTGLIVTAWFYFLVNSSFFGVSWPWNDERTWSSNQWIFFVFTLGLTATAIARVIQRPTPDPGGEAAEDSLHKKAAR